ncbi:Myb-like transcription factor family protein isoform 1 [Hibiscus syriacus]|uniref:Myb-like transcription factor family protein isoform 1 n=1 Tax=Hibiscus syriacus TaxID=106335 RepID=A0A6A2ZQ12_HIBSY|nr:Myb-like transcription factor family protein isoform 1 [Hibiscus syriacus]
MSEALQLPVIDLSSEDRLSTAKSIRQRVQSLNLGIVSQACLDLGFLYLVNHGVEEELIKEVFEHSKKFFALPVEEKVKFAVKNHRGYTGLYDEKLNTSLNAAKGGAKESFYIGTLAENQLNQWPSEVFGISEDMPSWRSTMEAYYKKVLSAGIKLISLIALALNLDEDFFQKSGALRDVDSSREREYGAPAHSDYGMVTLLLTDGVPGLQACLPGKIRATESLGGCAKHNAFIVNIGDMMERWTNCLFRSTMHRVMPTGQERYSVAFFLEPNKDCIVECLESSCSESCPPRFPPIRSSDYLEEGIRLAATASTENHRINI